MYGDSNCRGSISASKPCDLVQQIDDCKQNHNIYQANDGTLMSLCTPDVIKYGVEGATNTATSFGSNQTSLEAPSLNITTYYIPWLDTSTKVRGPNGSSIDIKDSSRLAWSNENGSAYLKDYIEQYGACQPTKVCLPMSSRIIHPFTDPPATRHINGASLSYSSSS
jgi:hypothetical protein